MPYIESILNQVPWYLMIHSEDLHFDIWDWLICGFWFLINLAWGNTVATSSSQKVTIPLRATWFAGSSLIMPVNAVLGGDAMPGRRPTSDESIEFKGRCYSTFGIIAKEVLQRGKSMDPAHALNCSPPIWGWCASPSWRAMGPTKTMHVACGRMSCLLGQPWPNR